MIIDGIGCEIKLKDELEIKDKERNWIQYLKLIAFKKKMQ
jgi:hypothetical protein